MTQYSAMMKTKGYRVVLKPASLLAWYGETRLAQYLREYLVALREEFAAYPIEHYRGIYRRPLDAFPPEERLVKWARDGIDVTSDAAARRRLRELLPPDGWRYPDFDETLVPSRIEARGVLALTDDPSKWEVIQVSKGEAESDGQRLGYDVGYWGGDHFSLIADLIVVPQFHPPPSREDFQTVLTALACLNEHILFDSVVDALEFKQFYTSLPWTETEGQGEAEFHVVRVAT
jgi:hypothetical protein